MDKLNKNLLKIQAQAEKKLAAKKASYEALRLDRERAKSELQRAEGLVAKAKAADLKAQASLEQVTLELRSTKEQIDKIKQITQISGATTTAAVPVAEEKPARKKPGPKPGAKAAKTKAATAVAAPVAEEKPARKKPGPKPGAKAAKAAAAKAAVKTAVKTVKAKTAAKSPAKKVAASKPGPKAGAKTSAAARSRAAEGREAVKSGKRPPIKDAIASILGDKVMSGDEVFAGLSAKGWLPDSNNPRAYVGYLLSSGQKRFEPAREKGRGFYWKIRETSAEATPAPAAVATSNGGGKKGGRKAVTKSDPEPAPAPAPVVEESKVEIKGTPSADEVLADMMSGNAFG